MKKKTCLLFVMLIFSLTSFVYAGNLVKKVYFSPYPILIDHKEYSSEMPILSYQDRTYVALREFSEMVGVKIDFVDETIIIDTGKNVIENGQEKKEDIVNEIQKNDLISNENDTEIESVSISNTAIVYITKTGTKYHLKSNCSKGNYYTSTLEYVIANGYEACKRCAK